MTQLLFHLPPIFHRGKKHAEVDTALRRLIERHGDEMYGDFAVDMRIHSNPDGRYLIKGGGRDVWDRFNVRKEHRRLQGIIEGKRCGTTENIGSAARAHSASSGRYSAKIGGVGIASDPRQQE